MLNTILLIACICIVIASFLYVFYWNRFLAWLLGLLIRLLYWGDSESSIYLQIGSVQFSIISGRVLLKDVHYHSSNQTVKIVKAQVAWRYWVRQPTTEEEIGLSLGEDEKPTPRTSSCRIHLSLHGFEWFLYNRTAAYDHIMSQIYSQVSGQNLDRNESAQKSSAVNSNVPTAPSLITNSLRMRTPDFLQNAISWIRRQLPNLDPKDLLPLGIEIVKGAIVCGNPSTPSLMVAEFQRSDGTFGIIRSRSKYDLYKQMLTLHFKHASVQFTHNNDYCESMTATGQCLKHHINRYVLFPYRLQFRIAYCHRESVSNRRMFYGHFNGFSKLWSQLGLSKVVSEHFSFLRKSENPVNQRRKSEKGHQEDTPLGADFGILEYAIERKLLETPLLQLCYYVDVAGFVPQPPHAHPHGLGFDIGNGDVGPEWGLDIVVFGGTLKYGPWADRQRAELQRAFFPPTYQNVEETPRLQPNDRRVWTAFRIFIELREDTTLVVPFREASKDWQWDGLTRDILRPRRREYALLHLTAGDKSSISYLMPMIADSNGYVPILEVHLDTITVTSSLNDIRLINAESCRVHCELPSPLAWDAEREWRISVSLRNPILYLLRDHINLFTDLGKDWSTGSPSDYYRFVPMVYKFTMDMHHYQLHLYANDHNIIDKPLIKDENALFVLSGARLQTIVKIPSNIFRPYSTIVSFSVDVPNAAINLSLPRWNTNALHSPKEGNNVAHLGFLRIDGSYLYYSEVRKGNVEQLKLDFTAHDVAFKALGWSIRYFMILKDNYFGSFTHFSTLYEYLDKRKKGDPPGDPIDFKYREGKSNMMQVEMSVVVKNGLVVLPIGLPGYETSVRSDSHDPGIGRCILLSLPELQLHFRMHDFYMEMSLNTHTIFGSVEDNYPETAVHSKRDSRSCLVIDSLDITANRLFGAPPRTLTYLCIWEIHFGRVKATCSAAEWSALAAAGKGFMFNFDDLLNAPAKDYSLPTLPDLTFLKLTLETADIIWKAGGAILAFSIPLGLQLESNDMGGSFHRKLLSVALPRLNVKFLLEYPGVNHLFEAADVTTDFFLDVFSSPSGWGEKSAVQADFVLGQDLSTGRVKEMLDHKRGNIPTYRDGVYIPPISLPSPSAYRRYPFNHARNPSDQSLDSIASQSSVSDDESAPAAVRDARLTTGRTIPSRPLMPVEDADENLSTGDESDNEDLTERSETDWPDSDGSGFDEPHSTLRLYRNFTKHYVSRYLQDAAEWDGPPLEMIRDGKLPDFATSSDSNDVDQLYSAYPIPFTYTVENSDTTVYRVTQHEGTSVFITPILVQVIEILEADVKNAISSPEIFIDSFLVTYLSTVSEGKKVNSTIGGHVAFDIRMQKIALRLLQHVEPSHRLSEAVHHDEMRNGLVADRFSLLSFTMQAVRISGQTSPELVFSHASCVKAQLDLAANDGEHHFQPPCMTIYLHDFFSIHTKSMTEISCSKFETHISHDLPEILVLTVSVSTTVLLGFMETARKLRSSLADSHLSFFYHILQVSNNAAVIDPLSTIQPSFLVQTGTPQQLRTDPIFRLLFHLRHSLWDLKGNTERMDSGVTLDDLKPLLSSRLAVLDPEVDPASQLDWLRPLFPDLGPVNDSKPNGTVRQPSFLSVKMITLRIVISDPNRLPSELCLGDLVATLRSKDMDFIELFSTVRSKATSQVSLRKKPLYSVQKISFSLSLGDLEVTVHPDLINFLQQALRVKRQHAHVLPSLWSKSVDQDPSIGVEQGNKNLDIAISVQRISLQAVTENLTFEFSVIGLQNVSSLLDHHQHPVTHRPMNHSVIFKSISIQARSPSTRARGYNQLAELSLSDCSISTCVREDVTGPIIHVVCRIEGLHLKVPRSAIRTYRFFEEWREDFLPGIEATMQAFLSELERTPNESTTSPKLKKHRPSFQIHGMIGTIGVYLRVMRNTWVSWEGNNTVAYLTTSQSSLENIHQTFGVQLSSQIFHITSDSPNIDSDNRVKLELPPIFLSGRLDGASLHALVLMHFLELKAKPSHWDTLLVVQQKFGQDFNDLVTLVEESRLKRSKPKESPRRQGAPSDYSIFLKMDGFRIGFEGLSSNLYLECPGMNGRLESIPERAWSIMVTDLSLSLDPRIAPEQSSSSYRQHRSVFVVVDFKVASRNHSSGENIADILEISVSKIHAVMQPSSIGEIGDFVDHLQIEILERRERRAMELAAFKEKTQQLLKTFEVGTQEPREKKTSMDWLNEYSVQFTIRSVGVAFPLDDSGQQVNSHKLDPLRAFLFSIKSIQFSVERGETGQAKMEGFSFQFVPRFRQSISSDFAGENHETKNRLLYPKMQAQLRSSGSSSSRQFFVDASVSGFILDLDSAIPNYVFALADMYRSGKDRVARLSAAIPRTYEAPAKATNLPSSSFFAALTFSSGKVCMHSSETTDSSRPPSFIGVWNRSDSGAEVFNLPEVSVWAEYRPLPARTGHVDRGSSILMFKTTIHSSRNTLRPTLLPFFTDIVSLVETRLRTVSEQSQLPAVAASKDAINYTDSIESQTSPSSLQISFSLRIDQSRLELTCYPDVNVVAALNWDSGGFMVTASPGARKVTFSGSVAGLTIGLKHGFLSEDCVRLDARNLAFSVTFGKMDTEQNRTISSISFVLDTEFLGGVKFSRLQDILCFKAVWLDRIPLFNTTENHADPTVSAATSLDSLKQEFTTLVLIRIRQIKLEIDLGQSISSVVLHLENSVLRSKFTQASNEVSLCVRHVSAAARGNVAGYADVSNCVFQTVRRIEDPYSGKASHTRMLELRMTSGPLIVVLESDYQKLLHYRAEPLEVEILDDWSKTPSESDDDRPLQLSFTVTSPEVVAVATVGTIPKLLSYANKFRANLEAQREGASRESQTFRISRSPRPDNPLSAVAEAMINSARSRLEEAGYSLSYTIKQHMSLRLDLLRLVVFPRTMADVEVAQFVGQNVRGRLDRLVESEAPAAKRDIKLSFSLMKISRYTQLGHVVMPPSSELSDGKEWLEELLKDANGTDIVGLPSMVMHMKSEETKDGVQKVLHYDFDSKFVRHKDRQQAEDIYITLNVGLYSWLTVLRKTLTREMEQAKTTGTVRPFDVPTLDIPRSATITRRMVPPLQTSPTPLDSTARPVESEQDEPPLSALPVESTGLIYRPGSRHIERLTMRQLGDATPDVMHPFFMKKAGFRLEDSLPQYVHEYATAPLEEIMEALLKLYSRQLLIGKSVE
ncbi:hypothetical protein K435DRAFT_829044 [Dendrothele bispora CBS 962.96]|uniref:Csf1 N-terminal domain-containing protein n=1 Tax=Dendrothele bispora (strain CBS 962.96) TaxID=1314807 RepID=A0A4S8M1F5_DENBC|nr:hypothetical protein K435DRAFT_829044 [Dendrothele bispora CBS 962.96]